jgi:C_GCAxxG_C_C family probable redox protein
MDRANDAYAFMAAGRMNCSQAILTVYCEQFGLERGLALRLAQGFGAGMGRTGRTCGAVTSAYMVLGLAQKMSPDNPRASIDRTYSLIQDFDREFKALHGSLICKELIGYDLSLPEDLAQARSKKVMTSVCPDFVRDAVKILESLLQTD